MEKGIAMQALKKSRTLWQMKGSSVHNVLLPCRRQWVRPKDGSPTGDTVNPHLDPKEAWSDGQPSRPWSNHSPLPRLLTCHLKTGPRGPALLDWGPDSPTDMIFLEGGQRILNQWLNTEKSHVGLEGVAEGPLGALDFGAITWGWDHWVMVARYHAAATPTAHMS